MRAGRIFTLIEAGPFPPGNFAPTAGGGGAAVVRPKWADARRYTP